MDGFDTSTGIILIAATNRPDILDPALLRPGRFDRQIVVDRPDVKGRLAILEVHAKDKKMGSNVDLNVIARRTPGFVGADLANLVNEASLLAARRGKSAVEMSELEEAIDRVLAGPERKSRVINAKEKEIIAYHEAGHALAAKLIPGCDPVQHPQSERQRSTPCAQLHDEFSTIRTSRSGGKRSRYSPKTVRVASCPFSTRSRQYASAMSP